MTIQQYQEQVDQWIRDYGVRYFNEMTNMVMLTEEVGELGRLIAREYGEQSFKSGKRPDDIKAAISEELADVLFVAVCLANQMDIDLTEAFDKNLAKKTNRDANRHLDNPKL